MAGGGGQTRNPCAVLSVRGPAPDIQKWTPPSPGDQASPETRICDRRGRFRRSPSVHRARGGPGPASPEKPVWRRATPGARSLRHRSSRSLPNRLPSVGGSQGTRTLSTSQCPLPDPVNRVLHIWQTPPRGCPNPDHHRRRCRAGHLSRRAKPCRPQAPPTWTVGSDLPDIPRGLHAFRCGAGILRGGRDPD